MSFKHINKKLKFKILYEDCINNDDPEYCESFNFGKGCKYIKLCQWYKNAKNNKNLKTKRTYLDISKRATRTKK